MMGGYAALVGCLVKNLKGHIIPAVLNYLKI
jgi:hypothetical protein